MWVLECLNDVTGKVTRFYLLGGNSYSIGRKGSQLQLAEDDPSLSRHHATLILMTVSTTEMDGAELVKALRAKQSKQKGSTAKAYGGRGFNVMNPDEDADDEDGTNYPVPEVVLLDTSKHGCYVNNERVSPITRKASLTQKDVLRFGAHTTARLSYHPIIATLSPTLSEADVRNTIRILAKFGCFVNNTKKVDKMPVDAYAVDQLLTPQQRKVEAAMQALIQRRQRGMSVRSEMCSYQPSADLVATKTIGGFASGVFENEFNQAIGMGGRGRGDDDGTASYYRQGSVSSTNGKRRPTDELDMYGFDAQRNEVRARPLEDVTYHISPADATALRLTPMMFVYITNELEIGEATAMVSMLHQYRPVECNYLYSLYESIFNSPILGPNRWPEPREMEHPALVDCPYYKPPLFQIDREHFHTYSTDCTFRMVHFGFLQDNLYPRYEPIITKGGGRATQIDPAKVIERLSNTKLFCNTSSVGETVLGENASFAMNGSFALGSGDFGSGSFAGNNFDTMSMRSGMTSSRSALFSRNGRRKSRSRRTKRIPHCLKLMGIVHDDTDSHGANLRIVLSSSVFQYLAQELKAKHGKGIYEDMLQKDMMDGDTSGGGAVDGYGGADGAGDLNATDLHMSNQPNNNNTTFSRNTTNKSRMLSSDGSMADRDDEEDGPLPNVDPEVIDAAVHLFDSGYFLLHEDNIHTAIYTHDTASQILPNSPGVLARCEIVDKAEETDSDATEKADSDADEEEDAPGALSKRPWNGVGDDDYDPSRPLRHEQLVPDPILHALHYSHLHREQAAMNAQQVPLMAMKERAVHGVSARSERVMTSRRKGYYAVM